MTTTNRGGVLQPSSFGPHPPTDQIQGHVGGWRNGFFINDNWQARRNLTLSLGLRYERSTPVQTYAGVADMLAEDFLTIIPSPSWRTTRSRVQVHRGQ
jgi:outer membrane receptor protein involved in Fe transport